jgi:hypothetical protein
MAKSSNSITYKNATVSVADGTITEYFKDCTKTYKIANLLKKIDGIPGFDISFKTGDDIPEDGEGEEN